MKRVPIALIVIYLLATAYPGSAYGSSFYLKAESGISYFKPKLDQDFYPDVSFPSTMHFGVGIGYKINDKFRSDIVATFRPTIQLVHSRQYLTDEGNSTEEVRQNFGVSTLMWNGYYNIYTHKNFTPYILGGIGVSKNTTGDYFNKDIEAGGTTNRFVQSSTSKTKISPAFNIGIGSSFGISDNFDIDIAYKFLYLGKSDSISATETRNGLTPTTFMITPSKLKAHEFQLNFIVRL